MLAAKGLQRVLGPVFVPTLVSNVVFLLSTIQTVSVAVVNFKGRPFMAGVLYACVCTCLCVFCVSLYVAKQT